MVTIAIYGWESENERDACIEHVRAQTLADVEILTQGEDEDSIFFRNRAIAEAKGSYIAFLDAKTRYVFANALQLMALTAAVEDAKMVVGKCGVKDGAKTFYPDGLPWNVEADVSSDTYQNQFKGDLGALSGCLWNVSFLRKNGLDFGDGGPFAEERLIRKSAALAGTVFELGRTFTWRNSAHASAFTKTETDRARIGFYLDLLRFADEKGFAALRGFIFAEIFEGPHTAELRDCYWSQRDAAEKSAVRAEFESLAALTDRAKVEEAFLNPLVSVIVPVYNVEKYLPRCLDSLVGQTLASIEIIVVDDGSPDRSGAIADEYASRYPQVKVVHRENGGLSAARNSGIAVAHGKYIGFVDSDDYVEVDMFDRLSQLLEKTPGAAFSMCGVKVEFLYDVSENDRMWAQKYFEFAHDGVIDINASTACDINCVAWNKLYRKDFLCENDIRFPEGFKNEDAVFSFFVFGKAEKMVATGEPFYHYLRNDKGIMARQVQSFQESDELPDALVKSMPLIAEYLVRDDRRDLLGAFFKRLCGAANGFKSERASKCVSQLLSRVKFFFNRGFLDARDLGWVQNQLCMYANFDFSELPKLVIDEAKFPKLREYPKRPIDPIASVVVPVYNQELYLTYCLESIRKQTLPDFEIICIDDGSTDRSLELLQELASFDGRIRVIHQENQGASATRNLGIREARGKYVVFIDADDYVERTYLSEALARMEADCLDMCIIDLICFDYKTRQPQSHYWSLKNQISWYPTTRVFTFEDMNQYRCMTGPCTAIWRRGFLVDNGIEFPPIVNGEDATFWMRAMPLARRIGLINKVYYHYRRGNPNSAVSRMHAQDGSSRALQTVRFFAEEWERLAPRLSTCARGLLAGRLVLEAEYHARLSVDVVKFLQQEGFARFAFHQIPKIDKYAPAWDKYAALMRLPILEAKNETGKSQSFREGFSKQELTTIKEIEKTRKTSRKDLYLITGQLNSTANAPIDSWTFFEWLQRQGIPSRYVMWRNHEWVPQLEKQGKLKDVILLDGDGVNDCEFLFKCRDILPRCKVFAQENGALNWRLRKWFHHLPNCPYVFLEHGIKYWKYTNKLGAFFSSFNVINNSSVYEKELLEQNLPGYVDDGVKPTCIVGGLPRLDTFRDERDPARKEFTVFVMFTWRSTFNAGQDVLEKSAYYRRLQALFSETNINRLARAYVKVVVSAHHHLVNHIKNLNFGDSIKIVPQSEIAFWKSHADCCLTDYSSIAFDYLFLDKPAIFWPLDREDPRLNIDDYNELVMVEDRSKDMINVCHSLPEVIEKLEAYAKRRFALEPEAKKSAERFFDYRSDICRHLYDALEEVAGA